MTEIHKKTNQQQNYGTKLNTYECIIFKVALFVLNTKETVNNSIYNVEKCDLSNAVRATVSTE